MLVRLFWGCLVPRSIARKKFEGFVDDCQFVERHRGDVVKLTHPTPRYRLSFLGAFRLTAPDGQRLEITSKKSIALLALLSTAETGERWRSWIQERLWGSLDLQQAQAGLRRELHRLRKLTNGFGIPLLQSDFRAVRLNLPFVESDVRREVSDTAYGGEFLEGLDIPGEESFEDWLRDMRSNYFDSVQAGDGEGSVDSLFLTTHAGAERSIRDAMTPAGNACDHGDFAAR